jgi:hypothetical protein
MRTPFAVVFLLAACTRNAALPPSKHATPPATVARTSPATSQDERWYETLADDHAAADAWVDAAANITSRPDLDHLNVLRGEALRVHAGPSVTELLRRRISAPGVDVDAACSLADALLRWDVIVGKPIAAYAMARAVAAATQESPDHQSHNLGISTLTIHRVDAGDIAALDEYTSWLVTIAPTESGAGESDSFVPMALFADRAAIAQASDRLFAPGSPWIPIVSPTPNAPLHENLEFLLAPGTLGKTGGFIAASGLNRHVVSALADKRSVGTLTVEAGQIEIAYVSGGSSSMPHADDPAVRIGAKRTVRVCDYYAAHLSAHDGAPAFDLAWSDSRRDAALAAVATWVKTQVGKPAKRSLSDM